MRNILPQDATLCTSAPSTTSQNKPSGFSPGKAVIRSINPSALLLQAVDFDPHSLRNILPQAAAIVHERLQRGDRLYVHCTAGLGRAPAVCIAYLYWFQGMTLDAVSPACCAVAAVWLYMQKCVC